MENYRINYRYRGITHDVDFKSNTLIEALILFHKEYGFCEVISIKLINT